MEEKKKINWFEIIGLIILGIIIANWIFDFTGNSVKIDECENKISSLEDKNQNLENKISSLEAEISSLKAQIPKQTISSRVAEILDNLN